MDSAFLWGWQNDGTHMQLGKISVYQTTDASGSPAYTWEWQGFKSRSDGGVAQWVSDGSSCRLELTSNLSNSLIGRMGSNDWRSCPPSAPWFGGVGGMLEYLGSPPPPVVAVFWSKSGLSTPLSQNQSQFVQTSPGDTSPRPLPVEQRIARAL
jgi:hypothetical protein